MAIPGFTDQDLIDNYDSKEYHDYVWTLAVEYGLNYETGFEVLEELREFVISGGLTENIINSDGTIDFSKITGPGSRKLYEYLKNGTCIVIGDPTECSEPPYVGYINNRLLIAYCSAGAPYKQMAMMPRERNLLPPTLMLLEHNVIWANPTALSGQEGEIISIAASYMTTYGETQLSGPIQIGPITSWSSVTVAIVEEDIPNYATSVKYYRQFGRGMEAVYRLVSEVKIRDGN